MQDSAHVSAYVMTDTANANWDVGSGNSRIRLHSAVGTATVSRIGVNTGAMAATTGTSAAPRHVTTTRTATAQESQYVSGALDGSLTTASNGLASGIVLFQDSGSTFSDRTIGAVTIGAGLTATQAGALYAALHTYMQGIGAAA